MRTPVMKHCRGVLIYSLWAGAFGVALIACYFAFSGLISPNPPDSSTQFWSAVFGIPMFVFFFPSNIVFYLFYWVGLANMWLEPVVGFISVPLFWGALIYVCVQFYRSWKSRHHSDEPAA